MYESKQISSLQNPLVKKIGVLQDKSRERKKSGLFVLEGLRELQLAIKGNYTLDTVLYQGDLISKDVLFDVLDALVPQPKIIAITKAIYAKLAYRKTTEGLVALAHSKPHAPVSYTHLRAHETDSYLVCRLLLEKKN